eukprot:5282989-Pyramimonas_sp.AAC.1
MLPPAPRSSFTSVTYNSQPPSYAYNKRHLRVLHHKTLIQFNPLCREQYIVTQLHFTAALCVSTFQLGQPLRRATNVLLAKR